MNNPDTGVPGLLSLELIVECLGAYLTMTFLPLWM